MSRPYFSERTGRTSPTGLTIRDLVLIFEDVYRKRERDGYFQVDFGYNCVDAGYVPGKERPLDSSLRLRFGARGSRLNPMKDKIAGYQLDDLLDMLEFLYDHIAKPSPDSRYHSYNDCGIHATDGSKEEGRREWVNEWNPILERILPPYRLTDEGVVELLPGSPGLRHLVDNVQPYGDEENVDKRVQRACDLFFKRGVGNQDRREALRELADVLEYLRKEIREKLPKKEEGELFNIANNYGIRHHNDKQNTEYDRPAYYPWIFHSYLATIDLLGRLRSGDDHSATG